MRRMTMLLVSILLWSLAVFAPVSVLATEPVAPGSRLFPTLPPLCCQSTTIKLGLVTLSCSGAAGDLNNCIKSGGTFAAGPCNADGACGGTTVCCKSTCGPSTCAIATEAACDAPDAAGAQVTESVPGTNCNDGTNCTDIYTFP